MGGCPHTGEVAMFYKDLKKEIDSKKLRRAYLFYGEDEGLMQELSSGIRTLAGIAKDDVFNYVRLDGQKADLQEMEDALMTLPFMGEKKLVEIFRADFFAGGNAIAQWQAKIDLVAGLLKDPPEETILIVYYVTDLDKKDAKAKALEKKSHPQHSLVVKMPGLKRETVQDFLEDFLKKEAIEMSKPVQAYLREQFEGSLMELAQEVTKISQAALGRPVEKSDVDQLLVKTGNRHKYDLLDLVMAGKPREALELYNDLMDRRVKPHEILEPLGGRLREAYNYKIRLLGNMPRKQLMVEMNERMDWLVDRKCRLYGNMSLARIRFMFARLLEAEIRVKSQPTEVEREIELLVLNLAASGQIR